MFQHRVKDFSIKNQPAIITDGFFLFIPLCGHAEHPRAWIAANPFAADI